MLREPDRNMYLFIQLDVKELKKIIKVFMRTQELFQRNRICLIREKNTLKGRILRRKAKDYDIAETVT